jgi:RNA polymerase sigma factor (sigma-70 family)
MSGDPAMPSTDEIGQLERAAASLSPVERQVLILSAGHGLVTRKIALRLGLSEKRVERLLANALTKFDSGLECRQRRWWRLW